MLKLLHIPFHRLRVCKNCFFSFNISAICLDSSADLGLVSLLIKCLDISHTPGVDGAVAKTFRTKCVLALSICVDRCGEELYIFYSNLKSDITNDVVGNDK